MCHIGPDSSNSTFTQSGPQFHYHEYYGVRPNRHLCCDGSSERDERMGGRYTPVELAIECARAKVSGNHNRFDKIKTVIKDIKDIVEQELRKRDLGMKPAPHEILKKLLEPMNGKPSDNMTQTDLADKLCKSIKQQTEILLSYEKGLNPNFSSEFF